MKNKFSFKPVLTPLLLLLLVGLSLRPSNLYSQKVKWDNDTIYKDSKPYALLIKSGGWWESEVYSLRTLSNKEVAVAGSDATVPVNPNTQVGYTRITFLGSGNIAHMSNPGNFGKTYAKAVVACDLISGDSVNPQGEKRFLALYPQHVPTQGNVTINIGTTPSYDMVQRNRNMPVTETSGTIRQDGVVIGHCTSDFTTDAGKLYTTITYTLPNGSKCAEATFEGAAGNTCAIITFKDTRTHSFTVEFSTSKEQEVAEFLVKNYYM